VKKEPSCCRSGRLVLSTGPPHTVSTSPEGSAEGPPRLVHRYVLRSSVLRPRPAAGTGGVSPQPVAALPQGRNRRFHAREASTWPGGGDCATGCSGADLRPVSSLLCGLGLRACAGTR
jgi:hypothetical protein